MGRGSGITSPRAKAEDKLYHLSREERNSLPRWTLNASRRADGTVPSITPGKIDEWAEIIYTEGQCAFLALEIEKETGGEIYALFDGRESSIPGHFVVKVAPEVFLDIMGPQSGEECLQKNNAYKMHPVTKDEVLRWQKNHQRRRQWVGRRSAKEQHDLAESFVHLLLS